MPRFDLVIVNGVVVTASDVSDASDCCIAIQNGKIHTLAAAFSDDDLEGAEIIDAEGAYVMPGGVDAHVHLCQDLMSGPHGLGGECADNFETGSRSAVAGGTTTMITFAPQSRSENDRSLVGVLEAYKKRADATGSYIDYGFHMIIVRNDEDVLRDELPKLVQDWGVTSCKVFMTYEAQRLSDRALLDVMWASKQNGITTMIHAENGDAIEWLSDKLEANGMIEPYYHGWSRPPVVEGEATNRAISLATLIRNPILFVHVGSSLGMDNVRRAQSKGLPIFAETCPQYLNLTWEDLKRFHSPTCFENSNHVCSPPPPPDSSDQDRLYISLQNGTCTVFSSDHCPFRYDHPRGKASGIFEHDEDMMNQDSHDVRAVEHTTQGKNGSFRHIPNGIPGVETRLALLYSKGLMANRITPQKFVELTSTNPAKLYGLYPQKGALMPGSDADLVIWHPDSSFEPFELKNAQLHHNVDYTPYEGTQFTNWPRYTILHGSVVWANGKISGKCGDGKYLKRGLSQLSRAYPKSGLDPRNVATWLDGEK